MVCYDWIVDEWRQKWHLSGQFEDSKPDDLIKDMADIQSHVRLKAIATIAKVAEYHPPTQEITMYGEIPSLAPLQELPEKLFVALECLLDDKVDRVKLAAAITLFSLNRPCEKVDIFIHKCYSTKYEAEALMSYISWFYSLIFMIMNFSIGQTVFAAGLKKWE